MKHWKGNSEEQRKQSSLNSGPGQYLYPLSNEEVIKMEKIAIQKGTIQKKGSTYYFFIHLQNQLDMLMEKLYI